MSTLTTVPQPGTLFLQAPCCAGYIWQLGVVLIAGDLELYPCTGPIGGIRYEAVETDSVNVWSHSLGGTTVRILMLSWEYPPRIVGGIARHVEELSWSLAKIEGVEVHVVTCEFPGAPAEEVFKGVHIHRVQPHGSNHADFFHWVHQLNAALRDRSRQLLDAWLQPKTKRSKPTDPKKLTHADGIVIHRSRLAGALRCR